MVNVRPPGEGPSVLKTKQIKMQLKFLAGYMGHFYLSFLM